MISLTLALVAAVGYGLSDFIGGVASRRTTAWPVAFLAAIAAAVMTLLVALTVGGSPSMSDLIWGGIAGVTSRLVV